MTLYALSSLNLNYKLYEGVNLDYKKLLRGVSNKITLKDLFLAQYKFLQKLDYLITSCYTDEFVQTLSILADKYLKQYGSQYPRENNEKVYSLLYKMYKRIQNDKVYPGNLHPFEMIDYLARDGI
jgi:hypothetical protein